MLRRVLLAVVALATAAAALLVAVPASAAPSDWATFGKWTGSSGSFATTLQQKPAGFPSAVVTSDSAANGVGPQAGTSAFLGTGTEVGAKYSSSQGQPFLNLRPMRPNDNPASTTTYVFERPTPSSGWTFVLGDVDADQVTITATDANNAPVDPTDLGFRSAFNYCAAGLTPAPACGPDNDGLSLPTWVEADGLLRGADSALDTAGAAAWFEPTVPLTSLTFTYAQRFGAPTYQTWFSALQLDISGSVTVEGGSVRDQTVWLYDGEGNRVSETTTRADGTYSFPGRATYDNYRVELARPVGFTADGPLAQKVDLSTSSRNDVDFDLRQIQPVPVSGSVRTGAGDGVAGVPLTLIGPNDFSESTTTDAAGDYLFDVVPLGNGYRVTTDTPDGFTSDVGFRELNVSRIGDAIGGQNFVLAPDPAGSVAGTVTDDDGPRAGVTVTVTNGNGVERVQRTAQDGSYRLGGLPPGKHTVTVTAPEDSTIKGRATVATTITEQGEDRRAVDFTLALAPVTPTHEVGGTVTDGDGDPLEDLAVTLTLPDGGGALTATTDADGGYTFSDLEDAAGYSVVTNAPTDYGVVDQPPAAFTVAGKDVGGLDFVLGRQYDVSASVTDTAGDPVPGAIVTLSSGKSKLGQTTGLIGTVAFTKVQAGKYTATIKAPSGFVVKADRKSQSVAVADKNVELAFALENVAVSPSVSAGPPASSVPPGRGPRSSDQPNATAQGSGPASEDNDLPTTGGPSRVILFLGLGLLVVGGGVALGGRLVARSRRETFED